MHILITGHKGFIGTALFDRLSLRNDVAAVHGIDINPQELQELIISKTNFILLDIISSKTN